MAACCPLCGSAATDAQWSTWGPLKTYVQQILIPFVRLSRLHLGAAGTIPNEHIEIPPPSNSGTVPVPGKQVGVIEASDRTEPLGQFAPATLPHRAQGSRVTARLTTIKVPAFLKSAHPESAMTPRRPTSGTEGCAVEAKSPLIAAGSGRDSSTRNSMASKNSASIRSPTEVQRLKEVKSPKAVGSPDALTSPRDLTNHNVPLASSSTASTKPGAPMGTVSCDSKRTEPECAEISTAAKEVEAAPVRGRYSAPFPPAPEDKPWMGDPLAEGLMSSPSPSPTKYNATTPLRHPDGREYTPEELELGEGLDYDTPEKERSLSKSPPTKILPPPSESVKTSKSGGTRRHRTSEVPSTEIVAVGEDSCGRKEATSSERRRVPTMSTTASPKAVGKQVKKGRMEKVITISDTSNETRKRRPSALGLRLRVTAVVNLKEVNVSLPSGCALLCQDVQTKSQMYVAVGDNPELTDIWSDDPEDCLSDRTMWSDDSLVGRELIVTQYTLRHLTEQKDGHLVCLAARLRFLSKLGRRDCPSTSPEQSKKRGRIIAESTELEWTEPAGQRKRLRRSIHNSILGRKCGSPRGYPGPSINNVGSRNAPVEVDHAEHSVNGVGRRDSIGSLLRPPSIEEGSSSGEIENEPPGRVGDPEARAPLLELPSTGAVTPSHGRCTGVNECPCCRDWHKDLSQAMPEGKVASRRHNRHRYVAQIAPTPSGFWDVGFPPTQQPVRRGI